MERNELKHPEKFCIDIRGVLFGRMMGYLTATGLKFSQIIHLALDEYLEKRGH